MYGNYLRYWNARPDATPLARMLYADQKTYLVELLMKQDQMSMATSIESRVPFLDHTFVEFAMHMPDRLKIRGGEQKYILKKAVEDLLPREIIYRKKMGFPTPMRQWLRDRRAEPLYAAIQDRNGFLASYPESGRSGRSDCAAPVGRRGRHGPHLAADQSATVGRFVPDRQAGPMVGRHSARAAAEER